MTWTEAKLRALPKEQLLSLYDNACKRGDDESMEVIAKIEAIGVPPRKSKLSADSPIAKAIYKMVNSEEATNAALKAVAEGLPALAPVDPMLQAALGDDYNPDNGSTLEAGFMLAQVMKKHGWEPKRTRKLPPGCVAKTAAIFVHIPHGK